MPGMLSRRAFGRGVGAIAATLLPFRLSGEPVIEEPEPIVLARAAAVTLSARETQVVLMPVPPARRSPAKAKPKVKGPQATPRTQLVFRDIVATKGGPAYEVFLVVEGPNVFQATSARIEIGVLDFVDGPPDGSKALTITLDASEAYARVAKLRGFSRNMRVAIVRRSVKDAEGKETVPSDPNPPEIASIELVRI